MKKCEKILVQCAICNKRLEINPSVFKNSKTGKFFCSKICYYKWRSDNLKGENSYSWKGGKQNINCSFCGKEFVVSSARIRRSKNLFCSKECHNKFAVGMNASSWNGGREEKVCKKCGKTFFALRSKSHVEQNWGIFCSKKCSLSSRKKGKNIECPVCGKEFYLPQFKEKRNEVTCCSKECSKSWVLISERAKGSNNPRWIGGKEYSSYDYYSEKFSPIEEVRRDPNNLLALQVRCTYCGKWMTPNKGQSQNRLKYLEGRGSNSKEGRFYCKGDKCRSQCSIYNQKKFPRGFKEATSREVQPELRKMCFERDGWKCIKCGSEEKLNCHHIIPVSLDNIESADLDNVITVCKKCHAEIHKKNGCQPYEFRCNDRLLEIAH